MASRLSGDINTLENILLSEISPVSKKEKSIIIIILIRDKKMLHLKLRHNYKCSRFLRSMQKTIGGMILTLAVCVL